MYSDHILTYAPSPSLPKQLCALCTLSLIHPVQFVLLEYSWSLLLEGGEPERGHTQKDS